MDRTVFSIRSMPKNQTGVSIIEALFVVAIFSIGVLAVAGLQVRTVNTNASSRMVTEATIIASNQLESLLHLDYGHDDLDPAQNPHSLTEGPYRINWNLSYTDVNGDGQDDAKILELNVSWNKFRPQDVTLQSIIPDL